jgi:pimeloyl-ACP methyl ester carboxylesterase
MATYVLVHGAWHGGWCWQRVAAPLREAGHLVLAPSLTGLGERAHLLRPEVNLTTHITDVVNLITYEDLSDVVLVGHSYGGLVISGVAGRMPERLAHLVYVDAFVPRSGQSGHDLAPERVGLQIEAARKEGDGWRLPAPPLEVFGVNDPADLAWATPRCGPMPLAAFTEPVMYDVPLSERPFGRTYVLATARASSIFIAHSKPLRDDPAWQFREIATGHDVMITEPEGLTRVLLEVVRVPQAAA